MPKALKWDDRLGYIVTLIGIPSAFLLHGYVGFIFGSIKANPWWSTVMMPVIFLFPHGIRNSTGYGSVYDCFLFKKSKDRYAMRGYGGQIPVLCTNS